MITYAEFLEKVAIRLSEKGSLTFVREGRLYCVLRSSSRVVPLSSVQEEVADAYAMCVRDRYAAVPMLADKSHVKSLCADILLQEEQDG